MLFGSDTLSRFEVEKSCYQDIVRIKNRVSGMFEMIVDGKWDEAIEETRVSTNELWDLASFIQYHQKKGNI